MRPTFQEVQDEVKNGVLKDTLAEFLDNQQKTKGIDRVSIFRELTRPQFDAPGPIPPVQVFMWAAKFNAVKRLQTLSQQNDDQGSAAATILVMLASGAIADLAREMVTLLESLGGKAFTQEEIDDLSARGTVQVSRAQQLDWQLSQEDVERAGL